MSKEEICNNCSSWFSNHKGPEGSCRLHYDQRLFSDTFEHFTLKPEKYKEPRILCQECDGARTVTDPGVIAPLLAVEHCRVCGGEGSVLMTSDKVPPGCQREILYRGLTWLLSRADSDETCIKNLRLSLKDWGGIRSE